VASSVRQKERSRFVKGRRLMDAAFEFVQEYKLWDAASKASHAIRLKGLIGSFNAKSALTAGDLCHQCFPE